jgi:hypothetical protein
MGRLTALFRSDNSFDHFPGVMSTSHRISRLVHDENSALECHQTYLWTVETGLPEADDINPNTSLGVVKKPM